MFLGFGIWLHEWFCRRCGFVGCFAACGFWWLCLNVVVADCWGIVNSVGIVCFFDDSV